MRQMYYKFFRTIHFIHQAEKQPKKEGVLVWYGYCTRCKRVISGSYLNFSTPFKLYVSHCN
jgi:hypothetical protein